MGDVLHFRDGFAADDWRGKLELLILQPSPFCNLDCDYCYLPDRSNARRMALGTLEAAARKVFGASLPAPRLSLIWHAGEPMAVPREWYADAFPKVQQYRPPDVQVTHHFQTNGVLIDTRWCDFIKAHDVQIGVSIDGPAWLHDRRRHTRDGRGTHARVMHGVQTLKDARIPFHVICVLTRESLANPDEIFDFFAAVGPSYLCFNVEEMEAENSSSSLVAEDGAAVEAEFRAFMARIVDRLRSESAGFRVREVDAVLAALRHPAFGQLRSNAQNEPGRILSVAWDGQFMTFSPELLGVRHAELGALSLGNVLRDPFPPSPQASGYRRQRDEIALGVERCRQGCKYFDFCLGGAPANKLGELGRFDGTATMFCRLTQQAVVDVVLAALEKDLVTARASRLATL